MIKEELEKIRTESINKSEKFLKETKLLIGTGSDGIDALRSAGLDHNIIESEKKYSNEIYRLDTEKEYGSSSFDIEELKNICIKYDLRLIRSRYFRGNISESITKKLKSFIENNPEIGNVSDNFYILAPSNFFEFDKESKILSKIKKFLSVDPILLYKTPKLNQFIYVHEIGEDYSGIDSEFSNKIIKKLRELRGTFFKSVNNMYTMGMSFFIILISTIFGLSNSWFTGEYYEYFNLIWIVTASLILSYFNLVIMFNDFEDFKDRETKRIWEYNKKRR